MNRIIAIMLIVCATAMAQEVKTVAVGAFGKEPEGVKALKYISTELAKAISKSEGGEYMAVERSDDIFKLIDTEHATQRSGIMDKVKENIVELGKNLNAQYLCIVESEEIVQGTYQISAKFVDVKTGGIVPGMMGSANSPIAEVPQLDLVVNVLKDEVFANSKKSKQTPEPYTPPPQAGSFTNWDRFGTWAANTVIPGAGSIMLMDDFSGALTQWILLGGGVPLVVAGIEKEDGKYTFNKFFYMGAPLIISNLLFNAYHSATYEEDYYSEIGTGERIASLFLNLALPGAGYILTGIDNYKSDGAAGGVVVSAVFAWIGYGSVIAGMFAPEEKVGGAGRYALFISGGILSGIHIITSIYHAANYGKKKKVSSNKYGGFNLAILPTRNGNGVAYGLMYNKGF